MGRFSEDLQSDQAEERQRTQASGLAIDDSSQGAGFWPRWRASWWDAPQKRMAEFAAYRPQAEYRLDPETGGIAYREGDSWYLEEPSGALNWLTGAAADMFGGGMPANVGGILGGLAGGWKGAVAGASGGELLKQVVQGAAAPEERSLMDFAGWPIMAGGAEALGEAAGWAGRKAMSRVPQMRYDFDRARRLIQGSREWDIPLYPAEVTGNREAITLQSLLHDSPRTGDVVDDVLRARQGAIDRAMGRYFNELSPNDNPWQADTMAARTAMQARDQMVAERELAAKPFYAAARADDFANVQQTVDFLDGEMSNYGPNDPTRKVLQKAKGLFFEEGQNGPQLITDVRRLDGAYKTLGDLIEGTGDTRLGRNSKRLLTEAKHVLMADLEQTSPSYKQGVETFREFSQPIDEFDESIVGQAQKTLDSPTDRLARRLFAKESSPYEIAYGRDQISSLSPEAWDALVRSHLQLVYRDLAESATGDVSNIGGMFRKKIVGSPKLQERMKIALGPQRFQRMESLFDVLEATGLSSRGQSATEPRQQFRTQIERQATPLVQRITSPYDWLTGGIKEANLDQIYRGVVNATMDPSTGLDFNIDRAMRTLQKYQGKITPERSGPFQAVLDAIVQASAQAGMAETRR